MTLVARRLQNAMFEMAASSSRSQGSGGGGALAGVGMQQLAVSGSVGSQNFTSTSPATITGTSISFQISRPTGILVQGFVTGKVTAGTDNGLFQILMTGPGSYSNGSGAVYCGVTSFITQFCYFRDFLTLPGLYTAAFQGFVDVGGTTFNVPGNSTVLEAIGFGL